MKVLYVANIPFPYIVDSFNELGKHCELTVLFLRKHSKDRDKSWVSNNIKNFNSIFLKGIEFGSENVLCFSVLKWLKPTKFDIICFDCYSRATSILGIIYMKLRRRYYIISADGGFIKKDNYISKKLKRFLIGNAEFWISSGDYTTNYLAHYGAKKEKTFHIPFTSILEKDILYQPVTIDEKILLRKKLNFNLNKKIIITVGRFIPLKRFDVLIKSAKFFEKNADVFIIGGEPIAEYLELINKNEIKNVYFVSFVPKKILKDYFKAADIFVLPTSSDVWGLVINEAMANGLPVITTDKCIAGIELIEDNKNGYIIPVGDENILAEKINLIINDASLLSEMSKNNIQKIKNYSIENMAKQQMNIFNEIIKLKKSN